MSSAGSQSNDGGNAPALSLLRVLGRRWLHIVIAVVVAGALGLIVSMVVTPTYKASAKIFLAIDEEGSSSVDIREVVQTQAEMATSSQAIKMVATELRTDPGYVAGHITAVPAESGYYFTITGLAEDQTKARQLVEYTTKSFKTLLTNYSGGDAETLKKLREQRDALQKTVTTAQQQAVGQTAAPDVTAETQAIENLNGKIANAMVAQAVAASSVRLAEDPVEAGQIAPKPFVSVLIAGLIGLFVAMAVIWIRYLRQPTVLDGRAAADAIGAPLIVGGTGTAAPSIDTIVSAMAAVLSPTVKVVALTPAAQGDLTSDTVAGVAASWSDDQGVVLVLDASPSSDVRSVLERLPRATSGELPRWAHEPTCLARSSGSGRGHVLYNRVSPSRASRPGGLAPILADRAPVVDLVLLLTPPLTDLPMTAASALQADAVVVITSPVTRTDELASVPRDWPALAERIVGIIHGERGGFRPSTIASETRGGARPTVGALPERGDYDRDSGGSADPEATDRYVRKY
ncbi:lipopolysaccharide biosynthesis protein [Frankia sp. CNm7]|uniref:Lipopolysaccharide biosynthesis protein n=1 Tax=Frankia nepalensis TaxID=1836974 RepID=A0A937RJK6_9ACTN|nr:Wzz/FepE/Etk N-terminal domain-containing protein [Frankia nepalensis]MBL7496000.1 lipopolysaccharide biosynthesis protein [Frankia nepalensis]MBL7514972.1 lipopolysaccharide biosynthesis protein [Frankia nepalensis]MBL7519203.1 lipopolysaccharide biosynthesis protein [Frankia nepalensis]MBL7633453.1 lipopolysaccharide biosynthesis protein [Frankia nepalensis]